MMQSTESRYQNSSHIRSGSLRLQPQHRIAGVWQRLLASLVWYITREMFQVPVLKWG